MSPKQVNKRPAAQHSKLVQKLMQQQKVKGEATPAEASTATPAASAASAEPPAASTASPAAPPAASTASPAAPPAESTASPAAAPAASTASPAAESPSSAAPPATDGLPPKVEDPSGNADATSELDSAGFAAEVASIAATKPKKKAASSTIVVEKTTIACGACGDEFQAAPGMYRCSACHNTLRRLSRLDKDGQLMGQYGNMDSQARKGFLVAARNALGNDLKGALTLNYSIMRSRIAERKMAQTTAYLSEKQVRERFASEPAEVINRILATPDVVKDDDRGTLYAVRDYKRSAEETEKEVVGQEIRVSGSVLFLWPSLPEHCFKQTHTHNQTHALSHTNTHKHTHTHLHTYTHTRALKRARTRAHTHTHAKHTLRHARTHAGER